MFLPSMCILPHHIATALILVTLSHPATSTPPGHITLPFYASSSVPPSEFLHPTSGSPNKSLHLLDPVTDPWPHVIPNMGKGVNITIPENYSKHSLPSGALTQVNIGRKGLNNIRDFQPNFIQGLTSKISPMSMIMNSASPSMGSLQSAGLTTDC